MADYKPIAWPLFGGCESFKKHDQDKLQLPLHKKLGSGVVKIPRTSSPGAELATPAGLTSREDPCVASDGPAEKAPLLAVALPAPPPPDPFAALQFLTRPFLGRVQALAQTRRDLHPVPRSCSVATRPSKPLVSTRAPLRRWQHLDSRSAVPAPAHTRLSPGKHQLSLRESFGNTKPSSKHSLKSIPSTH